MKTLPDLLATALANRPPAWESKELAALTADIRELQKGFRSGGGCSLGGARAAPRDHQHEGRGA